MPVANCPVYEAPRYYIADRPTSVPDRAWLAVHSDEDQGVKLAALCYLKSFKIG
jgi:hypothetical protein